MIAYSGIPDVGNCAAGEVLHIEEDQPALDRRKQLE
jgi:hypothetical protein